MDATQVIVLTSIVNIIITSLVGGIAVYVIQKKIDATIQRSLYEHQIRFATVYPKTLEILETYNQKVLDCSHRSNNIMWRIIEVVNKQKSPRDIVIKKEHDELMELAGQMTRYFQNNRIHFPSGMVDELAEIDDKAHALVLILLGSFDASDAPIESQRVYVKRSFQVLGGSPVEQPIEETALIMVAAGVQTEFQKVLSRLEKVYRLLAESKEKIE